MRRDPALLSIVACALLASACAPRPSLFADRTPVGEVHEVKVHSGDRLEIDQQTIVLSDAETPQPAPHAACRAESMIAARVTDVVRTALAGAQHIEVHSAGEPGDLKLVTVDGLDLGLTLIEQGLAVPRQPTKMDWCLNTAASG